MSANNTTYILTVDDVQVGPAIKNKNAQIKTANEFISKKAGYKAVVTTSSGKVVHTVSRRKITVHTKANTKTVEVSKKVQKLVPNGYVAAYERPQNGTVVFRNERKDATAETRYAVVHVVSEVLAGFAPTTRAAGKIQNAFSHRKSNVETAELVDA